MNNINNPPCPSCNKQITCIGNNSVYNTLACHDCELFVIHLLNNKIMTVYYETADFFIDIWPDENITEININDNNKVGHKIVSLPALTPTTKSKILEKINTLLPFI